MLVAAVRLLILSLPWGSGVDIVREQPEQVHLSLTGDPNSMTVTWTTYSWTPSIVEYSALPGPPSFNTTAHGNASQFVDGGWMRRSMYIHRVTLRDLRAGGRYVYHCGSERGWSPTFYFRATLGGSSWGPRLAVFGDMGNENAQSLSRLQKDTQMDMYDAILHVGDFAYDMDKDNARVGDEFMRQIESVAAYVPYMTCPGNHEEAYNFSNYRNRFTMPGDTEGLWYSWDLGPAHIISLSTEVYFYPKYGKELVGEQFEWLQRDLQEATRPSRRLERPWIITMGHRPMYCSNNDQDDCVQHESVVRTGLPGGQYGLEDLFFKFGVDLEIWAHEHSYERLWPVYNHTVYKGSPEAPYTNPGAPVHIITGSAGCKERLDPFIPSERPWSALRVEDYGYTRISITNKTHIHIQQLSDDQDGQIVDDFWLVKDKR
ncbi:acid phosphatase type 7 [Spea bombifrons]|uniref:acid phosphatase type 7 n=1 Tax=Spea bombifrons TaxID=233779 RepID=UPI00234B6991|nr:acid phosphatase type 7 [Spea bombifrons]